MLKCHCYHEIMIHTFVYSSRSLANQGTETSKPPKGLPLEGYKQ